MEREARVVSYEVLTTAVLDGSLWLSYDLFIFMIFFFFFVNSRLLVKMAAAN